MTTKAREMEMAEGLKVDTQQSPSNGRGTCASRADRPAGLWTRVGQSGTERRTQSTPSQTFVAEREQPARPAGTIAMRQLTGETKTAGGLGSHTQEASGPGGGNAGPSARRPIGAYVRKAGTRLAACLVVIATSLGFAAPVDAQGVRQPYGATLTVEADGSRHGCALRRCNEALTQDVAWLGGEGRLIKVIRLDSGTLRVQLDGLYGSDFHQPFTLHLGSTALAFADATYSPSGDNDIFTWESTGLSWSVDDSVQVRITHLPLVAPPFSPKADILVGSGWQRFSLAQRGSKDWFTVALENNKRYVIRIDTPQDSRRPRLAFAYSPGGSSQINEGGEHDCFRSEGRQPGLGADPIADRIDRLLCAGKSWIDIDTYRGSRPGGSYRFYVDAPHSITGQPGTEPFSYSIRVEDRTSSSAPPGPLAAVFSGAPETHDGSTAFTMQLEFNATLTTGWEALRDSITVTNGTLTRIDRVSSLSHLWNLEITPTSESFITIAVAPSGVCDGANGICAGGRLLEEGIATKIYGTRAVTTVTNAEITNGPGENGTWDVGETVHAEVTFSSAVTIGGTPTIGITLDGVRRDAAYTADIGTTGARFSYPVTAADAGAAEALLVGNSLSTTNGLIGDNGGGDVILDFEVAAETTEGLSIADAQATEGTDASLTFTVMLSPAATETVTVDYATADGTATAGDDYTATSGTLTFAPGETTKTIAVPVVVDDVEDDGETLTLTLSNAVGAELTDAEATGTIRNTEEVTTSNALTAAFQNVPSEHDGEEDAFDVRVLFDAALSGSWTDVRDAITVTNGTHTRTSRVNGRSDLWKIEIEATSDAAVTVNLRASVACGETGALCTSDSRRFETAISTVIDGPDEDEEEQTTVTGLTAAFEGMPSTHNGSTAFTFKVRFSEELTSYSYATLRDHSVRVTQGGTTTGASSVRRMVSGKNDYWEVTVTPASAADISIALGPTTDCSATGAMCTGTGDNRVALTSALTASVEGPPELSIADATVEEAANATVDFEVTLSKAAPGTVTVAYATSDGTAVNGSDYTAKSGTLTFNPGELSKTISVTVLEDGTDEESETFTMTLSSPTGGALLSDATATGTITNTDPMPKAWLTRFGRTVASQAVDAIGARMDGDARSHLQVGGMSLNGAGERVKEEEGLRKTGLEELAWRDRNRDAGSMTASELLLGSAFQLSTGSENGTPAWTAWGRFSTSGFEAEVDGVKMDGDVTSGFLGADISRDQWLGGLALSMSRGDGDFSLIDEDETGEVESTLTAIYPYAKVGVTERVDVWGMVGLGTGDVTLTEHADNERPKDRSIKTDISMRMGAIGARGELLSGEQAGGMSLAIKTDAFLVEMESDAVRRTDGNMAGTKSDASRVRLALEGSRAFEMGAGTLIPRAEIGIRQDGGDAETGTGVEIGGGISYQGAGFSIEGSVRKLVAHEESGYDEWGASGSVRIDPGASGRGLSLTLTPTFGAASSGVEQLWSHRDATGLTPGDEFEAESRFETELGYGIGLRGNHGLLTPYTGLSLREGGDRTWRTGTRWKMAEQATLGLEATRSEVQNAPPVNTLILRSVMRW